MKHFSYKLKRYIIQAKKKDTDKWTGWTITDDLESAKRYEAQIKKLGYDARILDKGVAET